MQVFIQDGSLVNTTDDIPIIASYPDEATITPDMHGADKFVMYCPAASIYTSDTQTLMIMRQDWRSDSVAVASVIDYEANRRINIAFPTNEQTKANAIINNDIITYGADSAAWPPNDQSQKATILGGWSYIKQVGAAATSLKATSLPLDPTDDVHWPAPITPIILS